MFIIKYIQSFILIIITILATFIFGIVLIMFSRIDHGKKILNKCELYWGKIICYFSGLRINVHGYKNIKTKRYIFCSNHSSALDIPISLSIINKPIVFLAKKQLFTIPFFGSILKSVGMIRVNRENRDQARLSVDKAIKIIQESVNSILIYPEGTRNKDNNTLKPFKKGCFIIAIKSGLPILPITISGASNALKKSSLLIKKATINIYFHKEISTKKYNFSNKDELLLKVRESIQSAL